MKLKRYPKYRKSEIRGLEEVPEDWSILRSDSFLYESRVQVSPKDLKGKDVFHYSIPVVQELGTGQVEQGEDIESSKLLVVNKIILVSKLNPRKKTVCLAEPQGLLTVCSSEFVPLVPVADKLDLRFLKYLVLSEPFTQRLESNTESATQSHQRVLPSEIYKFWWVWPAISEQVSIANFLDHKTKQIDDLIEQKEKLLTLLTEKRTAIITQAVTKGLNPKVKMKDSGIEWLGEVPEHWVVKRLKFLANRIIDGAHVTPTYVPEGVPFLRVTDIVNANGGELNLEDAKFIPQSEHKELTRRCKPNRNDVLLSKNGTIGITRVVDWDFEFSLFVSLCLIKLDSRLIDPYFLSYSFKGKLIENQISIGAKSNTVTNLHLDKIKEFVIPTPPKEEQIQTVEYLKKILDDFKNTEASLIDSVNKLKEYRSSLITSAVTGQIDVRKEVVA